MAVSPIKIYNKILEESTKYTSEILDEPRAVFAGRQGLAIVNRYEHEVIPYDKCETIFEQHGYGPEKAMKWINHWVAKGWLGLTPGNPGLVIFVYITDTYINKEKAAHTLERSKP